MAPQHRRVRARAMAVGAAAVVVSAALTAGPAAGAAPADGSVPAVPVPGGPAGATIPAVAFPPVPVPDLLAAYRRVPAFGAFLASDERGVARMEQLSRWLGGAELRVGHTYLPGNRWSDIEGDIGFLEAWARWRNARDDRMLVLNVPMQERNEEGSPTRRSAGCCDGARPGSSTTTSVPSPSGSSH
ncbi:hypothetical protein SHKM778_80390 [Streptomyces sp. KM77-8]|uniref:GH26 domain-containing protein n=1 Tax=Streptomyces haneummycinicus TaxID=3074435 RepID=A0AAT9HW88_9ACTN